MKLKFRGENDPPDWWIYEDWGALAHFDRSGYQIDAERIAQKLERESGTLEGRAKVYR
jgi:hypothetical protein